MKNACNKRKPFPFGKVLNNQHFEETVKDEN